MDLALPRARTGLISLNPGGLIGFQRQAMDQRKKNAADASGFVSESHYAPISSQAVTWPAARLGDIAVGIVNNSLSGGFTQPAGWSAPTSYLWSLNSYNEFMTYKVLDAADILAGGVTFTSLASDGLLSVLIYRGPTVATVVGTPGDTATAVTTIGGFTKAAGSKRLVAYACSRAPSSVLVSPPGSSNRISNYNAASHNFVVTVDDMDPTAYANGASLTYTGGSVETIAQAIELT